MNAVDSTLIFIFGILLWYDCKDGTSTHARGKDGFVLCSFVAIPQKHLCGFTAFSQYSIVYCMTDNIDILNVPSGTAKNRIAIFLQYDFLLQFE